ncbi:carbohydrate-binding-like protein [Diplodia corticola]|uniref:Carbohydrate-binding-like protein n=1 Tax=Diplodia corticola TaxID=236234 RepID=A0A1J9RYI0_9PEZI|nr:carbohydrate-binding-like protein [Diplodia corticola]OJD32501.1 carbohydrate-binding-like protein [Diplodia corticola]
MRSFIVLPALAALGASQSTTVSTDIPADVNPTPDALDLAFLRSAAVPTYSTVEGASSQDIPYATATAIAAVKADQSETPLSVFPAVTSVAINADGEDGAAATATATATAAADKRDVHGQLVEKRTACAPQATISNYYNVDVSTYDTFKADAVIASVANAAPTPQGYFQNFKNQDGANSAYAYLGYTVLDTGYDVNSCAETCTSKDGCLAFNIYFERDPTLEPGDVDGCRDPEAFANIKCSFWGSALDTTTANNYGQWRADFHVGIAGSNAYTSYEVGGPISGWTDPLSLNNAALNAPLRDCAGTWTYMGYKLFQDGPFDPTLCAAACDAQTEYNIAHPPSSGYTPFCAGFGTYLLTMTNSTGSYVQGQMCTMYTSAWGSEYAVNTASYDDSIGAKYTYSYSFFYSKSSLQPVCDADLSYLQSEGADFCTSYLAYSAPVTTTTAVITPSGFTTKVTTVATTTVTVAGTVTGNAVWKREDTATNSSTTVLATATDYTTVASLATDSLAILATVTVVPIPSNDTLSSAAALQKRSVATPASISGWASAKVSAACSRVATGTSTLTATSTAPTLTTTVAATATASVGSCTLPTQLPALYSWTALAGAWDGTNGQPASNPTGAHYGESYTAQLPFSVCAFGSCTSVLSVGTDGYVSWGDVAIHAYTNLGYGIYIYPGGAHGVFYRVSGSVGSRRLTIAWYGATIAWGHQSTHVTMEFREDESNAVYFKYFDVTQDASYGNRADVYVSKNGAVTRVEPSGTKIDTGAQYKVSTSTDGTATSAKTLHDRVECCTKQGWHSCTEFGADGAVA